jgi:hypothetical protein
MAVTVVTDKKDRYGREVGKVLVNGLDANLEQVQRGFAWRYKAYEHEQSANDRKLYDLAESEAKTSRLGGACGEMLTRYSHGIWENKTQPLNPAACGVFAWLREERPGASIEK